MSTTFPQGHVIRNATVMAYYVLKTMGRFIEGSHISPYKDFFERILNKKAEGEIPNPEVESFYMNKVNEKDFVNTSEARISQAIASGDVDIVPRLLETVWQMELATPTNASACAGNLKEPSRQLWEIFIRLDTDCVRAAHIEDVCDLLLRIFRANGHEETPEIIQEWFNNQMTVNFWVFHEVMATNYTKFLMSPIIGELYQMISTETIKEGRLTKKGHIVPNWKGRWFTLTASSLTYREAKEQAVIKTIVINDKTQVQNMPEAKGQKYRFRVLDGSSAQPTEMSAADEFTMREWTAFLKLAIKMHQVEGRNFLHKYRLAINTFPKSFFSQSSAVPMFTAAPSLPQVRKNNTDPTHRALKSTQSVPISPDNTVTADGIYELPPPLPPQNFDTLTESNEYTQPDPPKKGNSANRRRSSLDSSEIEHIRVDCDLEYAVVTKVVKKKPKSSADSAPGDRAVSPAVKNASSGSTSPLPSPGTPPHPPPHRRSPKLTHQSKSVETSPSQSRAGYAELEFENGKLNDSTVARSPNVPNKFAYSKLQFDEDSDPKPMPPPRNQSQMSKNLTESNIQNPHSNGSMRPKPTSLPELNPSKRKSDLDYAEVVFSNTAASPSITHRILGTPDEPGRSPRPEGNPPRVEYATVILTDGAKSEVQEKPEKKERPDGYENFDFNQMLANKANLKNGPRVSGNARLVGQNEPARNPPQPKPRASPRKIPPSSMPPQPPARHNH